MVFPYLKGLINKENHSYLSDIFISWVYFYCLIFSYISGLDLQQLVSELYETGLDLQQVVSELQQRGHG